MVLYSVVEVLSSLLEPVPVVAIAVVGLEVGGLEFPPPGWKMFLSLFFQCLTPVLLAEVVVEVVEALLWLLDCETISTEEAGIPPIEIGVLVVRKAMTVPLLLFLLFLRGTLLLDSEFVLLLFAIGLSVVPPSRAPGYEGGEEGLVSLEVLLVLGSCR